MTTIATMQADLEQLRAVRAMGTRAVEYSDGRRVEYRTDSELAAAIADLERRIAVEQRPRVSVVRVTYSKGV